MRDEDPADHREAGKTPWLDRPPTPPGPTRRRGRPLVPPAWYTISTDYDRNGRIEIDVTTKGRSVTEAAAGDQRRKARRRRTNHSRVILLIPGPNRLAPVTTAGRLRVRKGLERALRHDGRTAADAAAAGTLWLAAVPGAAVAALEAIGWKSNWGASNTEPPDPATLIGRMLLARRRGRRADAKGDDENQESDP